MIEYADRPAWPGPDPEPWWYRDCSPSLAAWRVRQIRARRETPYEAWLRRKNAKDRAAAPLYIRFGDLPGEGVSSTWRRMWKATGRADLARQLAGDFEKGVSVFRGRRASGGGFEVLPGSVDQAEVFATVKRQGRPAYVLEGREVGIGAGFEPVLKGARIVERIAPEKVAAVGIWAGLGALLGSPGPVLSALDGADVAALANEVLARASGKGSAVHGEGHWKRVAAAGAFLCERTPGASPASVLLFSLFHDAMRENDGDDPGHGARAATYARELLGDVLPAGELATLTRALEGHDGGETSEGPTIGVCWDADRLNLWRLGVAPNPILLSTAAARDPTMIERCRALQDEPAPSWGALGEWFGMVKAERSGA